jgi:hypothetical protein
VTFVDIITFLVLCMPVIFLPIISIGMRKALPALFGGVIGMVFTSTLYGDPNGIAVRTVYDATSSSFVSQYVSAYPLILIPAFFTVFSFLVVILERKRLW